MAASQIIIYDILAMEMVKVKPKVTMEMIKA
jgi:hypothetical protein